MRSNHEPIHSRVAGTRKIAVLRPGALGDFIFTLPALSALRAAYPDAEIVLLGRSWHADFLRERPGPVNRVVTLPVVKGVGAAPDAAEDSAELEAFFDRMRAEHFDVALQLHGGGRYSNPFVRRLGARVTAGMRAPDAPPLDRAMPYVYQQNERMRQLEAVALVGAPMQALAPRLTVTPQDLAEADAALPRSSQPLVVLQPGVSDPRRRWPPERFGALADALLVHDVLIAINGTADEQPIVGRVLDAMRGDAVPLCGKLSLAGLAGVLSRADLVVSNDTGPLYLAEAVGAATVGIYWLTNLSISGPLTRTRHRYAMSSRVACPTCGQANIDRRCQHQDSFVADIRVDDVLAPALDLLGDLRSA